MVSWRLALLGALASCRAVFGIDDPVPPRDATVVENAGLLMHVAPGKTLWITAQSVDEAWAAITPFLEADTKTAAWSGVDPTIALLVADGVPDPTQPFSGWFEGALLVDQHSMTLALSTDSYAFIDFARDGVHFTRLTDATATHSGIQTLTNLTSNIWYPIRMGWTHTFGAPQFEVRGFDASNTPMNLGPDHLRYISGASSK